MDVLAYLIGILVIIVGLAVSIALHEIGHLVPAKRFGVRVGQYMIGFGPTLWARRKGDTEYGVKALPLGGYISMAGMYPPSPKGDGRGGRAGGGFFATMVQDARAVNDETLDGDDDSRTFYRLPVWKRVIVMLGGPVMNLLLAIVLFTIMFSGIGVQQPTTTVSEVSACVPAAAGAECTPSDPDAPAEAAGVEPGDVLISVDGTEVESFTQAAEIIQRHPGEPIELVVQRDGAEEQLQLTPAPQESVNDAGETTTVGIAGITSQTALVHEPIWSGAQMAFENTGAVIGIVVQLPALLYDTAASLVTGAERDPNGPLSVVGVGAIAGEVAQADAPILSRVSAMLGLVGSLNVALFVFNLVPLLPLDGGHVAVALWDGVKRTWARLFRRPPPKPVDATRLVPVTFVVVVLLIGMMALLVAADIFNPMDLIGG